MPQPNDNDTRRPDNRGWDKYWYWVIAGSIFLGSMPLWFLGCNRGGCKDCNESTPCDDKPCVTYNVGGDMVNITGNGNQVNLTRGSNNNIATGHGNANRGVVQRPRKLSGKQGGTVKNHVTIIPSQPKPEEPKPEPKPAEKQHCTVVITYSR